MTAPAARESSWNRTRIVCTLGPASDPPGVLEALARAGMNVARMNLSHGEASEHARRIAAVRETAKRLGEPIAVLADLPGPKFRLATLPDGARKLEHGSHVRLALEAGGAAALPVRNPELLAALRPGERVFLADGAIELRVVRTAPGEAECEVVFGGKVRSGSGINLPDSELSALVPTEADRLHLQFALSQEADWIGVSFVQQAQDLARVRALLPPRDPPLLMAKIERRRALAGLDSIVAAAEGVMVARGDLGVETGLAQIPLLQKRIIATANEAGRPVVTATQLLESMVEHERPTRAEVTDVANALLDGTDAVMLSAESAIGRFPAAAAQMLQRVLAATESERAHRIALERLRAAGRPRGDPIAHAACHLAAELEARAIISPARGLATACALSRLRPSAPVVMLTEDERLSRKLAMLRGVAPVVAPDIRDPQGCVERAREWLYRRALAAPGDPAVLVHAADPAQPVADSLRTLRLD